MSPASAEQRHIIIDWGNCQRLLDEMDVAIEEPDLYLRVVALMRYLLRDINSSRTATQTSSTSPESPSSESPR
jgi:hypothetical protein